MFPCTSNMYNISSWHKVLLASDISITAEFTSDMETVQLLAWSCSTETKQLSFPLSQTAWVDLHNWKCNLHQLIWIYMKMYLEEAPSLSSQKYSDTKSSVTPFHPFMLCPPHRVRSSSHLYKDTTSFSLSPLQERFGTLIFSHTPWVSGIPVSFYSGFSSDKKGWRTLAQRTSLGAALDNLLN